MVVLVRAKLNGVNEVNRVATGVSVSVLTSGVNPGLKSSRPIAIEPIPGDRSGPAPGKFRFASGGFIFSHTSDTTHHEISFFVWAGWLELLLIYCWPCSCAC